MTINQQTKRAKAVYPQYLRSEMHDLTAAYTKPSEAKVSVWQDCYRQMVRAHGFDLRVISKTCQIFTCGYCYRDKKTRALRFVYITPSYTIDVEVEE